MKNNEYAFMFTCDPNTTFMVAQLLLSIKYCSPDLLSKCDIIICASNVKEEDKLVLSKIKNNILYLQFPENCPRFLNEDFFNKLIHKKDTIFLTWLMLLDKLSSYEKIVYLNINSTVIRDISQLFELNCDLAAIISPPHVVSLKKLFPSENFTKDHPKIVPSLIYFNTSILKSVDISDLHYIYNLMIDNNAIDGANFISLISHQYNLKFTILDRKIWGAHLSEYNFEETKIIRYISPGLDPQPWRNDIVYLSFPSFGHYYNKWLQIGGSGSGSYTSPPKGFFNPHDTYSLLNRNRVYNRILPDLELLREKDLKLKYDLNSNEIKFLFKSIPDNLYIFIEAYSEDFKLYRIGVSFTGLILKEKMTNIFNKVQNEFSDITEYCKILIKDDITQVFIENVNEEDLNILLNLLYKKVFKLIPIFIPATMI